MLKINPFAKDNHCHTFNYENTSECDEPFSNSNNIRKMSRRNSMQEESCKQLKTEYGKMQMILKFPEKQPEEEKIQKEVKQILSNILEEYIRSDRHEQK